MRVPCREKAFSYFLFPPGFHPTSASATTARRMDEEGEGGVLKGGSFSARGKEK